MAHFSFMFLIIRLDRQKKTFFKSFSCCLAFRIVNKLSKYLTNYSLCPETYSVHAMKLKEEQSCFNACTKKLLTWQVYHDYNK